MGASDRPWQANEYDAQDPSFRAVRITADVVPGTGGLRKVRWSRLGSGKQGGVRVIYYNRLANGRICLLLIYAQSARDNLPAHVLNAVREMPDDAED